MDPEGKILAEAKTKEDEVVIADLDLEACRQGKTRTFDFARHRRVEHYERIVNQTGVIEPPRYNETTNGAVHVTVNGEAKNHRNKKIRILLLNPNATPSMTQTCVDMVSPSLPPDVEIIPFTGPANDAPTAIEGKFDAVLSAAGKSSLPSPCPSPIN